MIEIFDNRVEITNPGGLPKGLKIEDFGKISLLRNPNIANLMQRIEYIEKMGTGIMRMQKLMKEAGLQPIKYEFSNFVKSIFHRTTLINNKTTQETTQEKIINILKNKPDITRTEIAKEIGNISSEGVKYHIEKLKEAGIIKRIGSTKSGKWIVVEK